MSNSVASAPSPFPGSLGASSSPPPGRSMGRQAVQYPRNSADRCWTCAPGHLAHLFHGFGCCVRHGPRCRDSRHGAQSYRCGSPAGQPRKGLEWLHSFYGIGTVITVLVGTFAFRLGIGWRTTSLTLITVPLLVALGFVNVDLPPLISDKRANGRLR